MEKKNPFINSSDRDIAEYIIETIYEENPRYWPYGWHLNNQDEAYIIHDKESGEPAGFLGWQVLNEDGKRNGYYNIGILPEYRKKGLAKNALSIFLPTKKSKVDSINALIVDNNNPSKELAKKLDLDKVTII